MSQTTPRASAGADLLVMLQPSPWLTSPQRMSPTVSCYACWIIAAAYAASSRLVVS